jgi:hypothetical protein
MSEEYSFALTKAAGLYCAHATANTANFDEAREILESVAHLSLVRDFVIRAKGLPWGRTGAQLALALLDNMLSSPDVLPAIRSLTNQTWGSWTTTERLAELWGR